MANEVPMGALAVGGDSRDSMVRLEEIRRFLDGWQNGFVVSRAPHEDRNEGFAYQFRDGKQCSTAQMRVLEGQFPGAGLDNGIDGQMYLIIPANVSHAAALAEPVGYLAPSILAVLVIFFMLLLFDAFLLLKGSPTFFLEDGRTAVMSGGVVHDET